MKRRVLQCVDLDRLKATGAETPSVVRRGLEPGEHVEQESARACYGHGDDDAEGSLMQVHRCTSVTAARRLPRIEPFGDDEPPGISVRLNPS